MIDDDTEPERIDCPPLVAGEADDVGRAFALILAGILCALLVPFLVRHPHRGRRWWSR